MAKRLSDYAGKQAEGRPLSVGDFLDQEVIVTEVRWGKGNHGEYAIMSVIDENGEVRDVMCGGIFVIDSLHQAEADEAFPLPAKFVQHGRAYLVE